MPKTLCIPLSAMPDARPTLARWFVEAWPDYYTGRPPAEVEADFPLDDHGRPPLILVALRDGRPCGTAALRHQSILNFASLTPWLGGLFVAPSHRRQGVATALIECIADEARRRGHAALYTGTVEAHGLFEALGWSYLAETVQEDQPVTVYRRDLD